MPVYSSFGNKGTPTITQVAPSSATLLLAANPNRISAMIYNNSSAVLYIGTSNVVTTGNGFGIPVGGTFVDDTTTSAWYGIPASGTGDARIMEIA